jgi:ankyrin repeat protein
MAAYRGHGEVVRVLLNRGASVDRVDDDGETALLSGAYSGCVEATRDLLNHGAAIDHCNRLGETALFLAAGFPIKKHEFGTPCERHVGHDAIVRELLRRGAGTRYRNIEGRSAIDEAGLKGNAHAVLDLFASGAELGPEPDEFEGDLLRWAACRGYAETAKCLLDRGAPVDNRDSDGWTPLMWAISYRRTTLVNLLIDRGAAVGGAAATMLEEFLCWQESLAERALEAMYDARDNATAATCYANTKDYLHDASALARRLNHHERVERLAVRLDHVKNVFRTQF